MRTIKTAAALLALLVSFAVHAQTDLKVLGRAANAHGLLCGSQGKLVLMLSGSPEQMGRAHGELLKAQIAAMTDKIFLMAGAYTASKNDWFFTRIDEVQRRTSPHIPPRFLVECDAMAAAAGLPVRDARNMNLFPEMFHCSGFAVRGKASLNGQILHARALDYMSEIGIQNYAVVMLLMPDGLNAWVNVSYAGFVGSVTAMNAKGLSIGEIGGPGEEGSWDGMPMNFLVRELMEKADNVEQALAILKASKRTCNYYYVLADKGGNLAGVQATSGKLLVLRPGEQCPGLLPNVPEDTVLISAMVRAKPLSERLTKLYGKIDVKAMMDICKRPVAMESNLHDAIFAPATLDLWVADAGRGSRACDNPYAHFNMDTLARFFRDKLAAP